VDDPDGVVVEAAFVTGADCERRLDLAPRWVAEPVRAWLQDPSVLGRSWRYEATSHAGKDQQDMTVRLLD